MVKQHAVVGFVQQSTVWLDFAQHAGAPGAQQLTVDDLQHPSAADETSGVLLQHGTQVEVEPGAQADPGTAADGSQQPASGPNPQPHCLAPETPQQPCGLAGRLPTVEQWLPTPPPWSGLQGC